MTALPLGPITAITAFVDDVDATVSFFADTLGMPIHFRDDVSCVFLFGDQMLNVLSATEAPGLIAPRPVAPQSAGARVLLTLSVDDVDAMVARFADRGVSMLNGPIDRPWGIRTAAFVDPGGHVWELAGPLRSAE